MMAPEKAPLFGAPTLGLPISRLVPKLLIAAPPLALTPVALPVIVVSATRTIPPAPAAVMPVATLAPIVERSTIMTMLWVPAGWRIEMPFAPLLVDRSAEHTSELQSH